jgi:hypothetical protein
MTEKDNGKGKIDRTARIGPPGQDSQDRTARIGLPGQDCQDRTARIETRTEQR